MPSKKPRAKALPPHGLTFIGIDPSAITGKTGGGAIALRLPNGTVVVIRLTQTEKDVCEQLRELVSGLQCFAHIENVGAMPRQGVSSTFKFGKGFGFLRGLLLALNIPFMEVQPKKWQQYYSLHKDPAETKSRYKARLRAKAQQLYPNLTITNIEADALLIMHHLWKTHTN